MTEPEFGYIRTASQLMIDLRIAELSSGCITIKLHPSAFVDRSAVVPDPIEGAESVNGKTCKCGCSEDGHDPATGLCYNGAHDFDRDCHPPQGDAAIIPPR